MFSNGPIFIYTSSDEEVLMEKYTYHSRCICECICTCITNIYIYCNGLAHTTQQDAFL